MSLHLYRQRRPGLADGPEPATSPTEEPLYGVGAPPAAPVSRPDADDLALLVFAARDGDQVAWTTLVRRFDGRLRSVARGFRMSPADVDDVVQTTWMQALVALPTLREPRALGAWLATMTRRECLHSLQRHTREVLSERDETFDAVAPDDPQRDAIMIARGLALRAAIAELPARQQALISALGEDEGGDYRALSVRLGMPIGSIGPIRARGLDRLRRDRRLAAFA